MDKSKGRRKIKRFSITLDVDDYQALKKLAESHSPRLSLQYVVQYAIKRFLESGSGDRPLTNLPGS